MSVQSRLAVPADMWGSVSITLALISFWLAVRVQEERAVLCTCPNSRRLQSTAIPFISPSSEGSSWSHRDPSRSHEPADSQQTKPLTELPSSPLSHSRSSARAFRCLHGKLSKHDIYANQDV